MISMWTIKRMLHSASYYNMQWEVLHWYNKNRAMGDTPMMAAHYARMEWDL